MKKVLSLVLAFVLVLGMIPTFAADAAATGALNLYDNGFITGKDGATVDAKLDVNSKITRAELAALIAELYGEKEEAAAFAQPADFKDAATFQDWAKPYIAYAQENGWMNGLGDGTMFGPTQPVPAEQLVAVLMNALGYDVTWNTALADAAKLGIVAEGKELTRGEAFEAMWTAVSEVPMNTEEGLTLGVYLGKLEPEVPAELAVTSVTALNLKQVAIKFNKELDKTAAQTLTNYKAYNSGATTNLVTGGSAELQSDNMTVIVKLGGQFTNGTTAKVVVSTLVDYTNDKVAVTDVTVPTVVGIEVTGPNTVTVEYSEPVTNLSTAEYTVDNGNYIVSAANANGSNKVDVVVGVNLTEGEHSIKFKGTNVSDYAGYKLIPSTQTFTVVKDTTAPTVTVKSATPTQIKLVFNKPVTNIKDANVKYRHTYNTDTYFLAGTAAQVTVVSSTEVTLDFTASPIPLGSTNLYISYSSATGTMIKDLWGNKLEATVLPLSITMDTVKPTVTEVKFVDASTLKVTFSETVDLTSAQLASNYSVKDASGTAVSVLSAVLGGTDNNVVTLTFGADALGGGSYNVEIKGVKDLALVKNIMEAYTMTLAVTDTVKPQTAAGKYVIDNTGTDKLVTVYIPFTEAMDPATIIKTNFLKNVNAGGAAALGTNDTVTLSPDGKSVTIVINNSTTVVTSVAITVGAVKDIAGNGLLSFVSTPALSADSIAVESVKAIGRTQIQVTFNGKLSTITAEGYSLVEQSLANVVVPNTFSVASHTVNSAGKSVVVFNLGTALSYDVTSNSNKIQLAVATANGTKSFLGTVVSDTTVSDADEVFTLLDRVAPVVTSVAYVDPNTITVTFSEDIEAGTLALTTNGFSVVGGTEDLELTAASIGTAAAGDDTVDSVTITLTGDGFVKDVTTVNFNSVSGLTDVAGNALASFSGQLAE